MQHQQQQQQQQQQRPPQSNKVPGGISISGAAQRYDYTKNAPPQPPSQPPNATAFYAGYNKPQGGGVSGVGNFNTFKNNHNSNNNWGKNGGGVGTNANSAGGNNTSQHKMFNKQRRPPGNNAGAQQTFYCEVCKVSCAGPQVKFKLNLI